MSDFDLLLDRLHISEKYRNTQCLAENTPTGTKPIKPLSERIKEQFPLPTATTMSKKFVSKLKINNKSVGNMYGFDGEEEERKSSPSLSSDHAEDDIVDDSFDEMKQKKKKTKRRFNKLDFEESEAEEVSMDNSDDEANARVVECDEDEQSQPFSDEDLDEGGNLADLVADDSEEDSPPPRTKKEKYMNPHRIVDKKKEDEYHKQVRAEAKRYEEREDPLLAKIKAKLNAKKQATEKVAEKQKIEAVYDIKGEDSESDNEYDVDGILGFCDKVKKNEEVHTNNNNTNNTNTKKPEPIIAQQIIPDSPPDQSFEELLQQIENQQSEPEDKVQSPTVDDDFGDLEIDDASADILEVAEEQQDVVMGDSGEDLLGDIIIEDDNGNDMFDNIEIEEPAEDDVDHDANIDDLIDKIEEEDKEKEEEEEAPGNDSTITDILSIEDTFVAECNNIYSKCTPNAANTSKAVTSFKKRVNAIGIEMEIFLWSILHSHPTKFMTETHDYLKATHALINAFTFWLFFLFVQLHKQSSISKVFTLTDDNVWLSTVMQIEKKTNFWMTLHERFLRSRGIYALLPSPESDNKTNGTSKIDSKKNDSNGKAEVLKISTIEPSKRRTRTSKNVFEGEKIDSIKSKKERVMALVKLVINADAIYTKQIPENQSSKIDWSKFKLMCPFTGAAITGSTPISAHIIFSGKFSKPFVFLSRRVAIQPSKSPFVQCARELLASVLSPHKEPSVDRKETKDVAQSPTKKHKSAHSNAGFEDRSVITIPPSQGSLGASKPQEATVAVFIRTVENRTYCVDTTTPVFEFVRREMHNFVSLRLTDHKKCSVVLEEAKRLKAILARLDIPGEDVDEILQDFCGGEPDMIMNLLQLFYAFSQRDHSLLENYTKRASAEKKTYTIVVLGNDPYSLEFTDRLAIIADNILEKVEANKSAKHYKSLVDPKENFYLKDLDRTPIRYEKGAFGSFYSRMLALFSKNV